MSYAVISCEKGNEYGHPHRETLEELRRQDVALLRTDERGTIVFSSDGRSLTLQVGAPLRSGAPPGPAAGRTPSGEAPSGPSGPGRVIGNRESRVYHTPDCPALPQPDRRVELGSAELAEKAGFRPHRACIGR